MFAQVTVEYRFDKYIYTATAPRIELADDDKKFEIIVLSRVVQHTEEGKYLFSGDKTTTNILNNEPFVRTEGGNWVPINTLDSDVVVSDGIVINLEKQLSTNVFKLQAQKAYNEHLAKEPIPA